jgi:hypothetical protein
MDELLIIFSLCYLAIKTPDSKDVVNLKKLLFGVILLLFITSFNSFGLIPFWKILLQSIIHLKFFIFLLFFIVWIGQKDVKNVVNVLFIITVIGFFFNLALGETLNQIFDIKIQYRLGELRPIGFQGDTGNLGSMAAICYIYYMFRFGDITVAKFTTYSSFMLIFSSLSSVRTPFISVVYSTFGAILKNKKIIVTGFFFISLIVLVGWNFGLKEALKSNLEITIANFEWLDDPVASAYIRGIMIFFSFVLSAEYFPFGSGAASYGSVFSEGSWVYEKIGLANSRFFLETDGIYDSNFASILGEFGYLGIFIYSFLFYRFYRYFMNRTKDLKFGIVAIFLLILSYSFVNPIFMNAYSAILYPLIIIALVNGRSLNNQITKEITKNAK